jgi:hypothetical protein
MRDRDASVSGEILCVLHNDTKVLVKKIEEPDWLVAITCAVCLIDSSITLVNTLTPELNPSAQTLPAEIFYWGF